MRHMQIILGRDPEVARRSYVAMLAQRGVVVTTTTDVFIEAVHRPKDRGSAWLCYVGAAGQRAA